MVVKILFNMFVYINTSNRTKVKKIDYPIFSTELSDSQFKIWNRQITMLLVI